MVLKMSDPRASAVDDHKYHIRPQDVVIAVMGMTGAGKSTFISHLTNENVGIGHGLEAYTSIVQIYKCHLDGDHDLYMIDTPGFDDTYRSDTDILGEIANWLGRAYSHKIKLTGIVYLHRILDVRVGGSAMKNLRMFKELCGDGGLPSVVLATTMWDNDDMAVQLDREKQLMSMPQYWSVMIAKGSRVFRQDKGPESAASIVQYLIGRRHPVVLTIQKQLVDEKRTLEQTSAGQVIQAETEEQRLAFQKELQSIKADLEEAINERDKETQAELRAYRNEVQGKLAKIEKDGVKMQADSEALQKQLAAELEEDREAIHREMQKNNDALREQEKLLALKALEHKHNLEMEERQFEINKLNAEKAALARKARPWWEKLFD